MATPQDAPRRTRHPLRGPRRPSLLRDLVTLTKPRIISLLLVTTVAPMFITDRGLPSLALVLLGDAGRVPDGRRRQRHQHVVRPGHRRQDVPHQAAPDSVGPHLPVGGLLFGVTLGRRRLLRCSGTS